MPHSAIAIALERRAGINPEVTRKVIQAIAEYLECRLKQGEPTLLPGIGIIKPSYRKPRRFRTNLPSLRGREYTTPLRVTPFLHASKNLLREEHIPDYTWPRNHTGHHQRHVDDQALPDVFL